MDGGMTIYGNVYAEGHSYNSMFAAQDSIHRYNPTHTQSLLREAFIEQGIEINTPDLNEGRPIAFDLFFEGRRFIDDGIPKYLIALENPNINRLNENHDYCRRFARVFAWDARLFDLPNVVKIMVPNRLSCDHFPGFAERDIFSCLINANKSFREALPSDLYRERINTIRWYERNNPDKFELYGLGWGKPTPVFDFWGKARRRIARLRTQLLGHKPFPSYRGEVTDKADVMRRCKYAYCYENTRDLSNYITEKIFDSFLSGCVPIYWGADNVQEHIPADCFIDRRAFKDTAEVHRFLLSVTSEQYAGYQSNIAKFLKSEIARKFSSEYFVSTIVSHLSQDLPGRA
jgi:alpha(1,3/1,4) fucosyltransferase